MSRRPSPFLAAAGVAATLASAAVAGPLPVKQLSAQQAAQLSSATAVPLSAADFSTSALITTQSLAKSQTGVQRQDQAVSATYAAVADFPVSPAPSPVTTGPAPSGQTFNFQTEGNSAQGWATTTAGGMPYLFTQAFGQSHAAGTTGWRAKVALTAQAQNLYVQFRLPASTITGATEENGPSDWQSRVRAELQVNGHPVWSSEATRITLVNGKPGDTGNNNCFGLSEKARYLSTFGEGLGFVSDAEKDSAAKTVTLWLGTYPAGQSVDVALVVRTDAQVLSPCCPKPVNDMPGPFCSRATAKVNWDNASSPVKFWIGSTAP